MWIPKNAQEIEVTALRGDPYARIRTAAELPISADLVDGQPYRKYAALAERSRHLTELGMTQARDCGRPEDDTQNHPAGASRPGATLIYPPGPSWAKSVPLPQG